MKMSEMFRLHRYEPAELFERVKAAAIADGVIKETKEYKFFKEPYELSDDWDWGALADQSEKFEREIQDLIDRMVQWVGPAETRKIFEKSAKAITKAKIAERKNSSKILERYDHMLNASALARQRRKAGERRRRPFSVSTTGEGKGKLRSRKGRGMARSSRLT